MLVTIPPAQAFRPLIWQLALHSDDNRSIRQRRRELSDQAEGFGTVG